MGERETERWTDGEEAWRGTSEEGNERARERASESERERERENVCV